MNQHRFKLLTLMAIFFALFMTNLDTTVMNLLITQIQTSLVSNGWELQWINKVYTLLAASLVLVSIILGNSYGRKRVFLAGLCLFTIASVVCSLAPNLTVLIVGRSLQGIGAAALVPTSIFMVADIFYQQKNKAKAIFVWSVISILALVAGSIISPIIADNFHWRSIFLVNIPLGAIAFYLTFGFVKEVAISKKQRMNLVTVLLSSILLASLAYTIAHNEVWRYPLVLWLLMVDGISLLGFLAVEYRQLHSIKLLRLTRKQKFAVLNVISVAVFFTVTNLLSMFNLFSQPVQAQTTEPEMFPVALLTPASDLVQGVSANFELLFARAGNDTIYSDDPVTSATQQQNIDFLFGDLFDNTPEEFEIVLNIQSAGEGGNPLLILDKNIPSVGEDRFVLGDPDRPYYTSPNPDTLSTTNLFGLNEFAVIYDFSPTDDTIQLNGKREDYRLVDVNGLKVEGVEQPFFGKAIFSLQQGLPDLIAYVIARPEVNLDLNSKNFQFVGDKPPRMRGQRRKIGQLGTTGNDLSIDAATDPWGNVFIAGYTTGPLFGTNQGSQDVWVAKYDSNGNQLWGKQFGSSGSDNALAITTDSNGNYYLAGQTGGDLFSSKQSQAADLWVAKFDGNGNRVWGKQFGTNLTGGFLNAAWGIDVDAAGNVYLSGLAVKENQNREIFDFSVEDDSWVTKFDSNGNQQWFTEIDTPFFNECYDLAVDKSGNSYFVGWTQGLVKEADPSRSLLKYDAWITKVNTAGQIEWIQQLGSTNEGLEFAWAVDTDSEGNVYTTGWTTGDIGINVRNNSRSQGLGNSRSQGLGNSRSHERDIWLTKLRPDGTQVWAKQFGSRGDDGMILSDMEIDAQDNIYLIGHTNDKLGKGQKDGNYNSWLAKFDTEGNNNWIQQFGSRNNLDYPSGVTTDNAGRIYVTGFTDGLLGHISEVDSSAVDAWLSQFDAKQGRLLRFIGDSKGRISIPQPDAIPTLDVTNNLVTAERLPDGDNIIRTTEGTNTNVTVASYGKIVSSLAKIFNPQNQNSFPNALVTEVNNGKIVIPKE
jgi:MFS family permease